MDITFEDKLSLLLTVRNYCVSPDLKLKITTTDKNVFSFSTTVEKLLQELKIIDKSNILHLGDYEVKTSSYKARDEYVFFGNNNNRMDKLASYIDYIKIKNEKLEFKDLTFAERLAVVHAIPAYLADIVSQNITAIEDFYEKQDLILIKNPLTKNKEIALRISKNITQNVLQQIIEFIFTEDLNNVYRALYNMVNYAGFSAEYVDTITPIETQVYWMYYIQDKDKKTASVDNSQLNLPVSAPNQELGF